MNVARSLDGRKLRIVHVFRAPLGGLFRHVVDLAAEQAARGHDVGLFYDSVFKGDNVTAALARIGSGLRLGVHGCPIQRNPHPSDIPALVKFAAVLRRLKPDIVHGHGSKGGLYARLPGFFSGLRGPVRAYTPHGGSFNYQPGTALHRLYMGTERLLSLTTDVFLFESAYIAGRYDAFVGGERGVRRVVANGIGPAEFVAVTPAPEGGFKPRKFLLVFAAVTLLFFSASGSKLAPYILPMFPLLAALAGAQAGAPERLAPQAARIGAGLVLLVAAAGVIYSARRNAFVPGEALVWLAAASLIALAAVAATLRGVRLSARGAGLVTAAAAILAWQCLLFAYAVIPPARSAHDLVAAVGPAVGPDTTLYSVGQYRETVSPYLGRTLTLVDYEGELAFGLRAEPGRQDLSIADFGARWSASRDAVAFFDPRIWDSWRRQGFPGRVVAADNYTVAVSRQ